LKTIAYLDCPTGIAGDMCLAALVDAGVPLDYLETQLASLGLNQEFTLSVNPVQRRGLRALYVQVTLAPAKPPPLAAAVVVPVSADSSQGHPHPHPSQGHDHAHSPQDQAPVPGHSLTTPTRHLPEIERLIAQANLPERVCQRSLAVFRRLAEAEAAVHGIAVDQVHFHEVGATDAIVDIVGTCLGLDYLDIDTLVCSPLPTGRGRVRAAHGWLPVPAPAVLKLIEQRQVPIYSNGLDGELVTPTGAAIATTLADYFGDPPPMVLHRTGLGAGGKDLPVANILRLWVGQTAEGQPGNVSASGAASSAASGQVSAPLPPPPPVAYDCDTITLLETQVDDMVPQAMGYLYERLYAAGALEVFTQPIAMKKSRPGLLITVLCRPADESGCTDLLFSETPTLGIRRQVQQRWVLPRRIETLETPYGSVAVKLAYHPRTQAVLNIHPEYEDCAAIARQRQLPWQVVHHTVISIWYSQQSPPAKA
jgi:pyridinium-3,5-bisthiocarboxylic acid mononucleotide nickel chelatase